MSTLDETDLATRSAEEVIKDHLRLRAEGDLERDLERNISPDIAVLTRTGCWRGHDCVREQATALEQYTDSDTFDYEALVVEGDVGYMEWSAGGDGEIRDGADSYVVRDGKIVVQTIHYTVRDHNGDRLPADADDQA